MNKAKEFADRLADLVSEYEDVPSWELVGILRIQAAIEECSATGGTLNIILHVENEVPRVWADIEGKVQ